MALSNINSLFNIKRSSEDSQLLDNEPIDNIIVKRDFSKFRHQQGAQLNDPNQNIQFIFGESIN